MLRFVSLMFAIRFLFFCLPEFRSFSAPRCSFVLIIDGFLLAWLFLDFGIVMNVDSAVIVAVKIIEIRMADILAFLLLLVVMLELRHTAAVFGATIND